MAQAGLGVLHSPLAPDAHAAQGERAMCGEVHVAFAFEAGEHFAGGAEFAVSEERRAVNSAGVSTFAPALREVTRTMPTPRGQLSDRIRFSTAPGFITPSGQCWLLPRATVRRERDAQLSPSWCNLRVDTGRYARPVVLRRAPRGTGTRSSPEPLALDMACACASRLPSNAGPVAAGAPGS